MKHSEKREQIFANVLTYFVPILLLVPNVLLGIAGEMNVWAILANVFLPGGVMLVLMAIQGRPGRNALLLIPFMILAAFQIVLLYLYSDGSIIGVDMFLNVVTTNPGEATELLANLKTAIAMVCLIYIPAIIMGIVAVAKKIKLSGSAKITALKAGFVFAIVGLGFVTVSKMIVPGYKVNEHIFPYNVIYNLGIAINRVCDLNEYHEQAADYKYDAVSMRPEVEREVYVAVIGETSRAANWQLCGYNRPTNPYLSAVSDSNLVCFDFVLSESNTTHKAVPLMLSPLTVETFNENINHTRSVISAFKEAGFSTAYVSNQCHNHSYIDFFAYEADEVYFMREPEAGQEFKGEYDSDMLEPLDSLIAHGHGKQLIVIHQYGSHFSYQEQYQECDSYFEPDDAADAVMSNRFQLINAYDNSIRLTDRFLSEIVNRLDSLDCLAGMIYASDHGEDIFDDTRKRFLHASPTPTFNQLYVPMLVYFNDSFKQYSSELYDAANLNRHSAISSSRSFAPTLIQLAGLNTPMINQSNSVVSSDFVPVVERKFLSDRNEALNLKEAGFRSFDFANLDSLQRRVAAMREE